MKIKVKELNHLWIDGCLRLLTFHDEDPVRLCCSVLCQHQILWTQKSNALEITPQEAEGTTSSLNLYHIQTEGEAAVDKIQSNS